MYNQYKLIILTILLFVLSSMLVQGQRCLTMEYLQKKLADDPNLQAAIDAEKAESQYYLKNIQPNKSNTDGVYRIPVVVHLIGNNVVANFFANNYQKVKDQISILNEDYRKKAGTNGDGLGVDTKIEFCLTF